MYGYARNVPNNNSVNITTPIALNHFTHLYATPAWSNVYVNHAAVAYVDVTTIKVMNYRSSSNEVHSLSIYWLCFC